MKHGSDEEGLGAAGRPRVCLVLGALLALQFRSQTQDHHAGRIRAEVLAADVGLRAQNQAEEAAGGNLRAAPRAPEYSRGRDRAGQDAQGCSTSSYEAGRIALGLAEVKGPGIVMSLEDSKRASPARDVEDAEPCWCTTTTCGRWSTSCAPPGAEAISINDQRVVGETAIRCVGSVLQVNGVPVDLALRDQGHRRPQDPRRRAHHPQRRD